MITVEFDQTLAMKASHEHPHEDPHRRKNIAIVVLVVAVVAISGIFGLIANTWQRDRAALYNIVHDYRSRIMATSSDLKNRDDKIQELLINLAKIKKEAARVPSLTSDLASTRAELKQAQQEAARVPGLASDLSSTRAELEQAQQEAAKVPGLASDLASTRGEEPVGNPVLDVPQHSSPE